MATARIDSGRVQLTGGGSVPMQRVSVPDVNFVGPRAQAQGAGQLADAIDRMGQQLFSDAFQQREREGLQFAAENPPTPEQLEAAKNGDLTSLDFGANPVSVFQQAVKKARALQISQRFEMEGQQQLVDILSEVKQGRASADQVLTKINTMTEGLGRTLAKIDPDASYKFRASMATTGNSVYREALNAQVDRERKENIVKLDIHVRNARTLLEGAYESSPENADIQAGILVKNIQLAATLLNDPELQAKYGQMAMDAVRDAKISVVSAALSKPEFAAGDTNAVLNRIRAGDMGKYSNVLKSLLTGPNKDNGAVVQIEKNYMEYVSNQRILRNDAEKADQKNREIKANDLMIEYFTPGTPVTRKKAIANEVAGLRVLSIEQLEKYLDPKAKDGDPYAFANLETRIVMGEITDPDELRRLSARAGMSGKQYQQLNSELLQGFKSDKAEALRYLRRVSGVPDVQSMFTSKDDEHKIQKNEKLTKVWKDSVDAFRIKNPGAPIPFSQLARDAETSYNATDRADAEKNRSRKQLSDYSTELISKKKVPAGFVIDENTNVDDLIARGIIPKSDKNDTAGFLRKHIETLRKTPAASATSR